MKKFKKGVKCPPDLHPNVGAHVKVEEHTPVQGVAAAARLRWWSPNNEDIHQSKTAIGTVKTSFESFTVKV